MQRVVSLKLTDVELELIDSVLSLTGCCSRSQVLRLGLLSLAGKEGVHAGQLGRVHDSRKKHMPRRTSQSVRAAVRGQSVKDHSVKVV